MHLDARTPNFKLELFPYFRVPQLSVVPACLVPSRRPRQAVAYLVPNVTCTPPLFASQPGGTESFLSAPSSPQLYDIILVISDRIASIFQTLQCFDHLTF